MNTDFRVSISLVRHPKTRRLIHRLGYKAFYSLTCLWTFTAMVKPNGILSGMDTADVEDAAEWQGEPGTFYQTLLDLRLLDITEAGDVAIHDWQEHNGYAAYAGERSARAREAANARWGKKTDAAPHDAPHDATHDADAYATHMRPAYAPSPSPSPSPDPALIAKDVCAEVSPATPAAPESEALPPALLEPEPEVLLRFPLAGKAGEYPITPADLDEWQEAFPGVDVLQSLRHCLQWNRDNPKRRKTSSGIRRHITSWLAREQDRNRAAPALPDKRQYTMTARQRYMRDVGDMLNAIAEAKRNANHENNANTIDLTPPRKLGPAVRTVEPLGRALPGGWA